jgi:hypothetical protein
LVIAVLAEDGRPAVAAVEAMIGEAAQADASWSSHGWVIYPAGGLASIEKGS